MKSIRQTHMQDIHIYLVYRIYVTPLRIPIFFCLQFFCKVAVHAKF